MTETLGNFESIPYFRPELGLIAAILLIIVWDLVTKNHRAKVTGAIAISLVALVYSAVTSITFLVNDAAPLNLFGGLVAFDDFANLFRVLIAMVTAIILIFLGPGALSDEDTGPRRNAAEMLMLLMVLTLGLNLMVSSRHLLMIYLSIEMVSVISFVMAGFKLKDRKSSEGALKYVIYGGVASGVMLYGMSWVYGLTGSLQLGDIYAKLQPLAVAQGKMPEAAFVGVICMLAGFGYKISAAPFHMWTPDVYEGSPTPVTAFLSVAPKAVGLGLMIRFFWDALGASGTLGAVQAPWDVIIGCLAMATMTVGNLSALKQQNVKRMLAYSSIAHAGYMLLGFSVFNQAGVAAIVFYTVTYCFMNLGAFLIVMSLAEAAGGDESINAFRGLGSRAPIIAVVMSIFLLSLAGIPPMSGFIGKFYLFSALLSKGGPWSWVLAVVGVLNSVVSLFYYARVLRAMYFEKSDATTAIDIRKVFRNTCIALAVPTLVLGVYWAPVYDFVAQSLAMVR